MNSILLNKEDQKKVLKFCKSCLSWINKQDIPKSKKNELLKSIYGISVIQLERIVESITNKNFTKRSAAELNLISFFTGLNNSGKGDWQKKYIVEEHKLNYYDFLFLSIKLNIDNDYEIFENNTYSSVLPKTIMEIVRKENLSLISFCDRIYNSSLSTPLDKLAELYEIELQDIKFIIEYIQKITQKIN